MPNKKASGFTANYDADGNLVKRETRMQEMERIFGKDGAFGFGKTSSVMIRSFAQEVVRLLKEETP